MRSLHPFQSGTLIFAAVTGLLLWCSSVLGGWTENWVHYRRLPEALARHRGLINLLGEARTKKLAEALGRNACGLGGNVSLGLLLGMTPAVCRFFGVGLDVRHVTLHAGTLTFAATSLSTEQLLQPAFLWALAGILGVAVFNLSVSFSLGLIAAMRARGLPKVGFVRIAAAVLSSGVRSLSDFVLPPRTLLPAPRPRSPYAVRSASRPRAVPPPSRHDAH